MVAGQASKNGLDRRPIGISPHAEGPPRLVEPPGSNEGV